MILPLPFPPIVIKRSHFSSVFCCCLILSICVQCYPTAVSRYLHTVSVKPWASLCFNCCLYYLQGLRLVMSFGKLQRGPDILSIWSLGLSGGGSAGLLASPLVSAAMLSWLGRGCNPVAPPSMLTSYLLESQ